METRNGETKREIEYLKESSEGMKAQLVQGLLIQAPRLERAECTRAGLYNIGFLFFLFVYFWEKDFLKGQSGGCTQLIRFTMVTNFCGQKHCTRHASVPPACEHDYTIAYPLVFYGFTWRAGCQKTLLWTIFSSEQTLSMVQPPMGLIGLTFVRLPFSLAIP